MKFCAVIVIYLLAFSLVKANAQSDLSQFDPMLVRLKARIVNIADSSAVAYVNIVNNRNRSGTITNNDGYFFLDVLNIDSLIVTSVGFERKVIYLPHNYTGQEVLVFAIHPVSYQLQEVEVKGEKPDLNLNLGTGKPVDIHPGLRGDAFNETPPLVTALFNPISYWHYYLSQREKQKRNVREAALLQKNWELHSENYNKEMVMKLTGLNETKADTFMIWFNSRNVLPYTSTEYEVWSSVVYYYELYKQERSR